jgi:DNA-binding response OmpR family regulator
MRSISKGGFPNGSPTVAEVTPTVCEDAIGATSDRAADIAKTPAHFLFAVNLRMLPKQIAGGTRNNMVGHQHQLIARGLGLRVAADLCRMIRHDACECVLVRLDGAAVLKLSAFANDAPANYAPVRVSIPALGPYVALLRGRISTAGQGRPPVPEISGIELLSQLRMRGIGIPVAFLTGLSLVDYERAAFARGAVDFIDKSRGVDVLARRLMRIVETRRKSGPVAPALSSPRLYGPLALRPGRTEWRGQEVGLTVCEYNVVELLASNAGHWITYRAVYDRMHYVGFIAGVGEDGYRQNVRSTVRRIRRKFHRLDPGFAEILNQVGTGYCWRRQAA